MLHVLVVYMLCTIKDIFIFVWSTCTRLPVTHTIFLSRHRSPNSAHESQMFPASSHKLIFKAFGCCALQLLLFFFNSKHMRFMTERVTGVQMFPSLICLRHVRLKWEAPVSSPVSGTQWRFKTHSEPFILCCWNNNVSRDLRTQAHLREYVCFIYMACHISAYEIKGCIT